MSEKSTKQLINEYQIKAKKNLGQNFINDKNIIKKMVKLSKINQNSIIIEIGPGLGILTRELAIAAKRVLAFEIDGELVQILKAEFAQHDNVEIIEADFLNIDLSDYLNKKSEKELVVCANLPYYITTPLLFKLFESELPLKSISVMMQKEMALRFTAKPGTKDYNALTVITLYKYETEMLMKVPKAVFTPVPKVDSAVVLFQRKEKKDNIDEQEFFALVKSCFKYRRKTIYNNYRIYAGDLAAQEALAAAEILPSKRAEELTLQQYLKLFEVHCEKKSVRES